VGGVQMVGSGDGHYIDAGIGEHFPIMRGHGYHDSDLDFARNA
jgi:hypothetical protein